MGDKLIDMEMGQNAGTKTVLLRSKYWTKNDMINREKQPTLVADTLVEAAEHIGGEK